MQTRMILVKVCGITNDADAEAAIAAGADALGFNFFARSPRFITLQAARRIIEQLPPSILPVGIFVNEAEPETVVRVAAEAGVRVVQLHGDESPAYCAQLSTYSVIKALRVSEQFTPERATRFHPHAILLDAYSPQAHGGTGLTFDWSLARRTRDVVTRLFLAGGLTAANVGAAIAAVQPFAVDVCSGVESAPGRKDIVKLRAFLAAVRATEKKLDGPSA